MLDDLMIKIGAFVLSILLVGVGAGITCFIAYKVLTYLIGVTE
jgi:hypothetical protein